ncbi:unnamed protein product [Closterium sp. NIES-54]
MSQHVPESADGLSLFDLTSGASPASPATADSTVRSQWATRNAAARLAVRPHLPTTERAHFSQYKSAETLYDAVVARYSSPATAALSRLMLPYLFPDLAAFPTVADLITHLRTSDTRYRAALPAEDHFLSVCPTTLTVDLLEQRLLAAETSIVAVGASRGDPRTPVFEGCSPSPLLPSVASAATADLGGFESVGAASAPSGRRRTGRGKGARALVGLAGAVEVVVVAVEGVGVVVGVVAGVEVSAAAVEAEEAVAVAEVPEAAEVAEAVVAAVELVAALCRGVAPVAVSASSSSAVVRPPPPSSFVSGTLGCGGLHSTQRCFGSLTDAWRHQFPDATEIPRWGELSRAGVAIFDLDYDAILAAMYAVSTSDEGDCYLCVPPDPGIEAAALGACEAAALGACEAAALGASAPAAPGAGESALSGTESAQVFHTFTLDSGASRSFFRDRTTLTPLSRPVAVSLADPSGGPVLASFSTVLSCPAAPSGTLSGLYLPSFSTNLVSGADLKDQGVDQFTLASQRVTHCTCARTGRHLATFTRRPGSSLYTVSTESPPVPASGKVAASSQVFAAASGSSPESAPCSCRLLSHQTLLWHHHLGHPSLPRLRGMVSRVLGHEHYFLLVVDDYSRYTTVFPLRSKGDVTEVLIDWIRVARLQLRESFGSEFPVLRLHSDRGGEFSSARLGAFCRAQGIRQTFTLPASPQQNGIAERRIGMVMDVARTSMIHAAAPHFLWPFAVQYAAHQLNLQPRVSLPETSPTLRWNVKVGDASAFRVWGSRAFVRDLSADKLSPRAVPYVFLGFPPDAPGWQFYHPTSRRVLSSQDVMFDESVPYYRLFPYRTAPLPPPPLFLAPGPPPVDPLPPQGPAPSGVSQVDAVEPVEVAVDSGAARGAEPVGAGSRGAESGGAEPGGAESGGAEPGGAEPGGAESGGAEPGAVGTRSAAAAAGVGPAGASGAAGAGAAGGVGAGVGAAGASGAAGAGAAGGVGAGVGADGVGAAGGVGAGVGPPGGTAGTAGGTGAAGPARVGAVGAGGAAGTGAATGGTGAVPVGTGGPARPSPYFVPLLEQVLGLLPSPGPAPPLESPLPVQSQSPLQCVSPLPAPSPYAGPTGGLAERREPASCPASPVRTTRTSRRALRPRPPAVPGTHQMTLRPSTAPLRVPLPSPPASSLPVLADPVSDSLRAASPTIARLLSTVVTDPSFESTAASALVAELVDFAACCRLDNAASLVAESASVCPPSVGGECALSTDVLEDRQEEFQCFAAALPHLVSMLIAPEGDPDAPDIPTPRSYAEAIEGPYSSQWQLVIQGGYGRTDPLLNKPFYPSGLVTGILTWYQCKGLGFESQCVHFEHPRAGGCQRSIGDPRLILGKGYRLVVLGGYGRTDPLLNKPFYPSGLVTGILTCEVCCFPRIHLPLVPFHSFASSLVLFSPRSLLPSFSSPLIPFSPRSLVPLVVLIRVLWPQNDLEMFASPGAPYLFPELSAFATVKDLVSHHCTSNARYRAALLAGFLAQNPPPMYITLYFIVTHLPDSLRAITDHFLSLDPTALVVDLLEQHLFAAKTSVVAVGAAHGTPRTPFFEGCSPSPLAPSYASAAAVDILGAGDVGAASTSGKRRSSKGKGDRGGGSGSGGGGGGSSGVGGSSGGGGSGGGSGGFGGGGGGSGGGGGRGGSGSGGGRTGAAQRGGFGSGQRQQQQRQSGTLSPQQLREWFSQRGASGGSGSCPYVIRTGDRAGQTCGKPHTQYRCFSRLDDAWRTEFGDEAKLPCWAELLRTQVAIFDLDFVAILAAMYALCVSAEGDWYLCVPPDPGIEAGALGASDSALPGNVPVEALHTFTLDSVLATSSSVLPCPAVPSASLSVLHLPSFSTNLVSIAALQDAMVTTTTPRGQRVSICTCTRTGRDLATFTRRLGSSLYTLATEPPQVAVSAQVSASGMHSRLLVSGLPRSLPPLPPSLASPFLPCIEGRQRAALHSSSFPPTTAPLQTLHMDVWGPARITGQGRERYFVLVVDDYRRYTTVFPLSRKGEVSDVLIPWIRAVRLQLRERFHAKLPVLRLHSDRGVMEVARTSMIHAAAPHFLWPFAIRYAANQLNLWPHVSLPETSPTLRWMGKVGDVSVFPVWGSRAFVRDTSADKLSACAIPCPLSPQQLRERFAQRTLLQSGASGAGDFAVGDTRAGGAVVTAGACGTGGAAAAGPGGARTRAAGAGGARAIGAVAGGIGAGGGAVDHGAGGAVSGGTGAGGTVRPQEDVECLAATVPRFASMLLAPEGDRDAPYIPNPRSYAEAITGPYSSQWQAAIDAKMAFWKSTRTYVEEVPPPGANIVDGMWIFRVKRPTGSPPAVKARYVARGSSQGQGVDYFQTFSPTPKMTTLPVLLHVAAQRDYELHSLDFSTAFLQGSLHEEIWLSRPPGFIGTTLAALGFAPSTADPSLFLHTDTSLPPFYVLVYVDDLVFANADTEALTLVKSELQKRHTCTDLDELRSYLGLQITRD